MLIFTLALGLSLLCVRYEDRWLDRLICKVGTVISCIPEFWLSLVLILVFAVNLRWLPSSGAWSVGNGHDISDRIVHLILPMTAAVAGHLWYYAYIVTTVEKRQIERHQTKRQREEFYVRSVSARPRNVQWD